MFEENNAAHGAYQTWNGEHKNEHVSEHTDVDQQQR